MASELYVETLKGLTSGANANKVIIPAGQTLDASAGGVELPAGVGGKVLQVKHSFRSGNNSVITFSASSGTSALYGTGFGNRTYNLAATINITPTSTSSSLICIAQLCWTSMADTSTMAHGQIITLNDTTAINPEDYPWYPHSTHGEFYYPSGHVQGVFEPNSTSEQIIRLRPYVYIESGSGTGRFVGHSLIVMEIAG